MHDVIEEEFSIADPAIFEKDGELTFTEFPSLTH